MIQQGKDVIQTEIDGLCLLRDSLNEEFLQSLEILQECIDKNSKIVLTGIGKSGNISQKIAATLTSTGSPAVVLNHVDALHGDIGIIQKGDVILVLSFSGESDEIGQFLPAVRRFSNKLIAMTGNRNSTLAERADYILEVPVTNEACPFNLAPTASTTAMLALGDALAMCLLHARGFSEKDFAMFHPSGAIGRRLLMKVKDVMRKDRKLVLVSSETKVRESLSMMTNVGAGCACVIDQEGRLSGIFTDGDLRRNLLDGGNILEGEIGKVMTKNPICIQQDSLAVEALKIFDEKSIDDLVVVNEKIQPVGLVDSQDLPKIKLL